MLRSLARALGALLCLFALAPSSVSAHAVLVEARPGDGERLDRPPAEIELRFNEPVVPVAVRLLDASGAEVQGVAVEPRGETLVVHPPSPLPEGTYLLSYRVTSVDGHPVGATLRFGVGVEPMAGQVGAAGDRAARWTGVLARWLFYVAALGAAGLALFVQVVRPPGPVASRANRLLPWLAAAGLAAVVFRLGAAGLELVGLGPAALATDAPWTVAAGTTLGRAAATASLGLALLILAGRGGGAWLRWPGAVAVAASFALTGHAASAAPRWLAAPALAVHALGGAFWLGSLLPLLWCLRLAPEEASVALRRFSAAATVAVGALALAGAWLAWLQLGGRLARLWETAYGLRLLGKLLLVAGLLALAAANRFVLTPRLARTGARRWLGRTLVADLALGLAVLALTASFPLDPPPRAAAATARKEAGAEGMTVFVAARDGQAALTLIPGRPGPNRLEAWVTDASGAPVLAEEATVSVAQPEAGIEPVRLPAAMPRPGVYVAAGLPVPLAGRWRLRLDLLVDDFTKRSFEGTFAVGGERDGTSHHHRPGGTN
ncbi:MAG TPA: CopD family protein [Geminicoccaceae bacterium]|nr:CopD family protein [Geminicoccaceae bacterium]